MNKFQLNMRARAMETPDNSNFLLILFGYKVVVLEFGNYMVDTTLLAT